MGMSEAGGQPRCSEAEALHPEGSGLGQPENQSMELQSSFPVPTKRLVKRWSQALHSGTRREDKRQWV